MWLIVVEYSAIASTRLSSELDTYDNHVSSVDLVIKPCNLFISSSFLLLKIFMSIFI
jgi:undecaprenyl pyrophosphate synthase